MSSDGILRLDLDLEDAVMPSGTHHTNTGGTVTPKEAIEVLMPLLNVTDAEDKQPRSSAEEIKPEDSPKKNIIKPPMPPTKETKPISVPEDEPDKDDASEKRVCIILYSATYLTVQNIVVCLYICITWSVT